MSKSLTTYLFGRLNLIATFDDKFKFIYDSITTDNIVSSRTKKFKFGFFEVEEIHIEEHLFLVGSLTKFVPNEDSEVVNLQTRKIDKDLNKNQVVAKSNFYLDPESGLIAFNPIGTDISEKAFREKFAEIIEISNTLTDAEIQIISEEYGVFKALEKFDIINKVKLKLHPSNPSMRDLWKDIDNKLQQANVESYNADYNSEKGLNIKDKDKIYSEIAMASDGYGEANITGKENGEQKIASTGQLPVKCEVNKSDADLRSWTLLQKFKEVWKRMKS